MTPIYGGLRRVYRYRPHMRARQKNGTGKPAVTRRTAMTWGAA
jgi:hypothetical protein